MHHGSEPGHAKAVYWENESRLDRDNDGTACEN